MEPVVKFALAAVLLIGIVIHLMGKSESPDVNSMLKDLEVPKTLINLAKEHKTQEIIKVTDGIYVAINFALGNSILLEGSSGLVIVDTTESMNAAMEIAEKFRNISRKPVKAIIYTHHHPDHIMGTQAFMEDLENPPEIYAHHLMPREMKQVQLTLKAHTRRGQFQFGKHLQDKPGHKTFRMRTDMAGYQITFPTHLVHEQEYSLSVAGLELKLIHIPGETQDQLGVWIADKRAFLVADDLYKCFPNLYAIRGTAPRDVNDWSDSLNRIRKLRPEILIGSHHKPIYGADKIYDILTAYRAGIQLVHDQTVRFINQGMHPDEIANKIKLPPELEHHQYLQQCYGTLPWSSKGIYLKYMGWFSGYAEELNPLTPSARADRMIKLVGSKQLLNAAKDALKQGDSQWALELASHVHLLHKTDAEATTIRREAMRNLAAKHNSTSGRHYFLSSILDDLDLLPESTIKKSAKFSPISQLFQSMRVRLKTENTDGVDVKVCIKLKNTDAIYHLHLHIGVLDVRESSNGSDCDFHVVITEDAWRNIVAGEQSRSNAQTSGAADIDDIVGFSKFMDYFEPY